MKYCCRQSGATDLLRRWSRGKRLLRGSMPAIECLAAMKSPEGYQPKAHHKIEMITLGG
jgi:hypothetical protein